MKLFLPNYQCKFTKGYIAQHCLLVMIENWELAVKKRAFFGCLLTDLLKAFYYL